MEKDQKIIRVFKILIKMSILGFCVVILTSCATGGNRAPVHDRATTSFKKVDYHTVSKGETLYSIAWRYGWDAKQLARQNGIGGNSIIYPGQKIYVGERRSLKPVTSVKKVPQKTEKSSRPVPSQTVQSSQNSSTNKTAPQRSETALGAKPLWRWPSQGRVIAEFSSQSALSKGIDIEGRLGESVLAAAAGVVVYSGNGIRGYGNLLIIKHNETYLSAYAHNSKIVVGEKQVVKAGQKVAEIGKSGTNKSKLHFEIRQAGKPIDPRTVLPKR